MQAVRRILSAPDSQPLPDPVREQLVFAIRKRARQQDVSSSVTRRYQAWTFVFVSWCHDTPPHRIGPDRIGEFRDVLRACSGAEETDVHEAMDALAFLFGNVEEAEALLASVPPRGRATGEPRGERTAQTTESSGRRIRTLQIGWQKGKPSSGMLDQADGGSTDSASAPVFETAAGTEEEPSTAEACIARFQTQIESLHASDAGAATAAGRQSDRTDAVRSA